MCVYILLLYAQIQGVLSCLVEEMFSMVFNKLF